MKLMSLIIKCLLLVVIMASIHAENQETAFTILYCYLSWLFICSIKQENGGHISTETRSMLKHCATEVVEATEAYTNYENRLHFVQLSKAGLEAYNKRKTGIIKDKFASELADIICCCTIIAGREDIDLDKAVADCLEKNRKRAEGIGDKL